MKRDEFIGDVELVIETTKKDYFLVLEAELHRAIRVWVEDAIQLLPQVGNLKACHQEGMISSFLYFCFILSLKDIFHKILP